MNLIVRLNEEQKLVESFFLHRSTKSASEYLNFFLGKSYYRDVNLYLYMIKYINSGLHQARNFLMKL